MSGGGSKRKFHGRNWGGAKSLRSSGGECREGQRRKGESGNTTWDEDEG